MISRIEILSAKSWILFSLLSVVGICGAAVHDEVSFSTNYIFRRRFLVTDGIWLQSVEEYRPNNWLCW